MRGSRRARFCVGVIALALVAVACSTKKTEPAARPADPSTKAATLAVALNSLLGEHVILAASATGAALGGRTAQFQAAAASLDANSVDIAAAVGSVYGQGAKDAFLPLWRKHIGFVVDYTNGLAKKNKAAQDKAVADLTQYTKDFGAFLNSANPNLTRDGVAALVLEHVLTLKTAVDAQAAGDFAKVYSSLRSAYEHMQMIGSALAGAIAKQKPSEFPGSVDGAAASLRATLNIALREHVWFASLATDAALGGRQKAFEAAASALDANSVDLSKAVASVYGSGAGDAFLPLWRKHIGFFVDYTTGVAAKDKAKQDKAVADLTQYTKDFGAFLNSASPALATDAVAALVLDHVLGLKGVVDAQAAKDSPKAYAGLRTAASHMQMIADALASTIVKQFPDKFTS